MVTPITLDQTCIETLDLSPVHSVVEQWRAGGAIAAQSPQVQFDIQFSSEPNDPRELSEIPEVRLWFVRLDAYYPWFSYLLDWEKELTRYTAMLVPHQFSPTEGIQFNPEALELFVMGKVFTILNWLHSQGINSPNKVKFMIQILGYDLDDGFFDLL